MFISDVKWIKITTNMFDDEKIKLIESMPDKDAILVIWIKLLIQAGRSNASGYIMLNDKIPYTDEMLSTLFDRPLNTIRLALKTFQDFGMIDIDEGDRIFINNWDKHQNIDGLNKIREQRRIRQEKHRKKKKLLEKGKKGNVTVTLSNGTEVELELDKELDKDKDKPPYKKIKNTYNKICKSLPSIRKLSRRRKEHINARWREEKNIEVFKTVFEKAEKSSFMTGNNNRNWTADFDWIIKNDNNFNKILEGKYDDKEKEKYHSTVDYDDITEMINDV